MRFPGGYRPAFLHQFPSSYRREDFFADLGSGLTVAFIALPLAIGFGIASGCQPSQGLWTAIAGGILISAFGGSRFQIGRPTGPFVPILAGVVAAHGYPGLAVATLMAGFLLVLARSFKLGELLRFIPYPVFAGFTSGIAVIIFLGQVPGFLGLTFPKPPHAPELLAEVSKHIALTDCHTLVIGATGLLTALFFPKISRRIPAPMVTKLEAALRACLDRPRIVILRLRHVPAIHASDLLALEVAVEKSNVME